MMGTEREAVPHRQPQVLLVDDDGGYRRSLGARLRHRYRAIVREASEGLRAIREAEGADTRFDLILMDVRMPGMTGLETCAVMRSRGIDSPIMLMTGSADSECRRRANALGVPLVGKPVRDEQIRPFLINCSGEKS